MGLEWITFRGKQILSCSYQEAKTETEQLQILEKQMKMIEQAPRPVLLLVDMRGMSITPSGAMFSKDHLSASNQKIQKIALVGVTGLKKVVVDGIGRAVSESKQEAFDTIDEAKAWLVS